MPACCRAAGCTVPEGAIVRCNMESRLALEGASRTRGPGAISRMEGGRLRFYPSMDVWRSYGSPPWSFEDSSQDCCQLGRCAIGADMPMAGDPGTGGEAPRPAARCTVSAAWCSERRPA